LCTDKQGLETGSILKQGSSEALHTKHTDEKSSKTEDSSIPQKNPWIKNEESLNPQKPSSDMRSSFEDWRNLRETTVVLNKDCGSDRLRIED
jgi:hypothetical protein